MSWGGEEKKKPFNSRNSAVWTPELQHTRIPAASEHIKYKQSPFGLTHSHQPLKTDFFNQNPCFIPWEINLNVAKCAITHSKRKWEMTKFLGSILGQDPHFVMSFYFKTVTVAADKQLSLPVSDCVTRVWSAGNHRRHFENTEGHHCQTFYSVL